MCRAFGERAKSQFPCLPGTGYAVMQLTLFLTLIV
jgi:hypothetical protein